MSDAKPRRTAREAAPSDASAGQSASTEAGPMTIAPEAPGGAAAEALPGPAVDPLPPPPLREAAVEAAMSADPANAESPGPADRAVDDAWTALAEMQAALARGYQEIALEMTAIGRSDLAAATAAATAMLDARTFAEAVEISAGLVRRRADAMIEGSARLSEISVQAATAASRPFLSRLTAGWSGHGHS